MADMIQIRRDTASNWTSANPILAQGEMGAETDTSKIKIGDGTTAWASLGYLIDTGGYAAYGDTTANFTGTLQNSGSNVLVDTDIGSTVQAYDATLLNDADIGVSVQAYDANITTATNTQTLTNKTLTAPVMTGDIYANGSVRGNVTAMGALDIDCSAGNYFTKTISSNSTFTFSTVPAGSYAFTLELTHTSGAATWPVSVKWPADTAPSLTTGKTHIFVFVTDDGGTRWRGAGLVDYVN